MTVLSPITSIEHLESPAATPCASAQEYDMPQVHHQHRAQRPTTIRPVREAAQDARPATPAEILAAGGATVPRWVLDREARHHRRTFLHLTEVARQLHETRDLLQVLRSTTPDAAALADARRAADEMAHALCTTHQMLASTSAKYARAAAFVHELLVNKGYTPAGFNLPEVER